MGSSVSFVCQQLRDYERHRNGKIFCTCKHAIKITYILDLSWYTNNSFVKSMINVFSPEKVKGV